MERDINIIKMIYDICVKHRTTCLNHNVCDECELESVITSKAGNNCLLQYTLQELSVFYKIDLAWEYTHYECYDKGCLSCIPVGTRKAINKIHEGLFDDNASLIKDILYCTGFPHLCTIVKIMKLLKYELGKEIYKKCQRDTR